MSPASVAFVQITVNVNTRRRTAPSALLPLRSSFTSACPARITRPSRLIPISSLAEESSNDDDANGRKSSDGPDVSSSSSDYLSKLNRATERRNNKPPSEIDQPITILGTVISPDDKGKGGEASSPEGKEVANTIAEQKDAGESKAKPLSFAAASRSLWRISWICWWPQFLLTGISSIIILFSLAFPSINISSTASTIGFILTSASIIFSFISLIYTYSYTRLSIYLNKQSSQEEPSKSLSELSSHITTRLTYGMAIILIGLLISTLGLQSVVGTLLARLLTSGFGRTPTPQYPNAIPNSAVPASFTAVVQPIDILVVQACANVIFSLLFAAICTSFFLLRVKNWEKKALSSS